MQLVRLRGSWFPVLRRREEAPVLLLGLLWGLGLLLVELLQVPLVLGMQLRLLLGVLLRLLLILVLQQGQLLGLLEPLGLMLLLLELLELLLGQWLLALRSGSGPPVQPP